LARYQMPVDGTEVRRVGLSDPWRPWQECSRRALSAHFL